MCARVCAVRSKCAARCAVRYAENTRWLNLSKRKPRRIAGWQGGYMDDKAGASRATGPDVSSHPGGTQGGRHDKEQQAMIQAPIGERDKAVKILAKSIFRE